MADGNAGGRATATGTQASGCRECWSGRFSPFSPGLLLLAWLVCLFREGERFLGCFEFQHDILHTFTPTACKISFSSSKQRSKCTNPFLWVLVHCREATITKHWWHPFSIVKVADSLKSLSGRGEIRSGDRVLVGLPTAFVRKTWLMESFLWVLFSGTRLWSWIGNPGDS